MIQLYEKNDKRRLYQLINMYLSGEINGWTFCNEFYYCFDLELKRDTLTDLEANAFSELGIVAGRYTNIEEDLMKYPGTYFTDEQLKQKIIETISKLKDIYEAVCPVKS